MNKVSIFALSLLMAVSAVPASAQLKKVTYADGNQKLNGIAAQPAKSRNDKAGILILPAWKGIDEHSKRTATRLAASGYYTFIADIYGEGKYPASPKEAGTISSYYKEHITEYHHRIQLALEQLVRSGASPQQIVVIGYCFGGTGALEAARINMPVKGVVSFHGGLGRDTTRPIVPIQPKVLVLHGADDPYAGEAQVKAFQDELRTAKADWEMIYYANAVHAFTEPEAGNDNSKGAAYNEKAAKRSWEALMQFLAEIFP
jgi:dienelactone hydrolase